MRRTCSILPLLTAMLALTAGGAALAATTQIPPWYVMTAALEAPPQVKVPVRATVTVTAPAVDLADLSVTLLTPPGWSSATPTASIDRLKAGESRQVTFELTPPGPLPNGSIMAVLRAPVPKAALQEHLRATMGPEGPAMAARVAGWPTPAEGFAEIPFALFAEEGFYPLTGDMWTSYDDRLKGELAVRGPVFLREAVVTPHQAQTDVEMYDKLAQLLVSDPAFGQNLEKQGIDLARKRKDQLVGLYVLATEAFLKSDLAGAAALLDRLQEERAKAPAAVGQDLALPAGNLRGLVQWAQGDRKAAEETLRTTFYSDRKAPAQRYLLRNIGLLMLEKGDQATAREMFRLALELKPTYTLLRQEYDRLKKP